MVRTEANPQTPHSTMVSISPKAKDAAASTGGKNMFSAGSSRLGKIPESMEVMSDESSSRPWKSMDVRSSDELSSSAIGFLRSRRGMSTILAFAIVLFVAVSRTSSNKDLVAPIRGDAYLSPAEFRDVRPARKHESVLITGGLGFIGSHVVDLLLHRGFSVTILDDESNGHNHNRYTREMVPNDITVVGELPTLGEGSGEYTGYYTHVVHLAAAISVAESMEDPDKYERINYQGSQKVVDWIRDYNTRVSKGEGGEEAGPIRKLVAASSAAIYGDPDPKLLPLQETAPYGGKSPYADTKYRMEGIMHNGFVDKQNSENTGSPKASAVALRFFNVYGPRQDPKNPYSGVISLFLDKALNGADITILGDGLMTRDFVYVKDVARAIVLALLQEGKGEDATFAVYNVCTGKSITINTLAEQVRGSMKSDSKISHLDPRDGDIRESSCNPNGAKGGIGFVAAVPQEEGLEKTASWFRMQEDSRG